MPNHPRESHTLSIALIILLGSFILFSPLVALRFDPYVAGKGSLQRAATALHHRSVGP